ncbi:MAG: hypothetical protein E4H26_07360, partial [Flavobacteriales bacterium]
MKPIIWILFLVTFTVFPQGGQMENDLKKEGVDQRGNESSPQHQTLLDSANYFKKTSIEKSIDFIAQSIAGLGNNADGKQLSKSLTMLGEVYQYHNQLDSAISSYKDALTADKTM